MKDLQDPRVFDTGKKGFLTYEEYRSYSLNMFRQPLSRKEVGDNVEYIQIKFRKDEIELDGVFDFFSSGEDNISPVTLAAAVSRLEMEVCDMDIMEMVNMFGSNGTISRNLFTKVFEP